jgi:DNA-3-methyladenine glycosylase II
VTYGLAMTDDQARAHLRAADPVLAGLIDRTPDFDQRSWLADLPPMDMFGALVFMVTGQQLSVASARGILNRLLARFDDRMPTPAELLTMSVDELRAVGLSRAKAATLRAVAGEFADGSLRESDLRGRSDEEIEARLITIPGIGPWTVHGVLIIALNRPDVVLPGDLALRKIIRSEYDLDHLPTQREVLAIAQPWRPYRSLAVAYLFRTT